MIETIDGRVYNCTILDPDQKPCEPGDSPATMGIINNLLAAVHAAKGTRAEIQYTDDKTGAIWAFYVEAV